MVQWLRLNLRITKAFGSIELPMQQTQVVNQSKGHHAIGANLSRNRPLSGRRLVIETGVTPPSNREVGLRRGDDTVIATYKEVPKANGTAQ